MLLVDLPPEILLAILQHVDVPDVLNIRKTCRTLHQATFDRGIWITLLQEQVTCLPFSLGFLEEYRHDASLSTYSTPSLQTLVVRTQRAAERWSIPRQVEPSSSRDRDNQLHRIKRVEGGSKLLGLEVILDRWILAIYFEGAVRVYDAEPPEGFGVSRREHQPILRASLAKGDPSMSYAVSMHPSQRILFLALTHPNPPYTIEIFLLEFDLLLQDGITTGSLFKLVQTIHLPSYKNIKALSCLERVLVLTLPTGVEIVPWDANSVDAEVRTLITVLNEDLDSLVCTIALKQALANPPTLLNQVDGIVAVTFFGPYLLIFRTHTLSIHDYKGADKSSLPPLKHIFSLTFSQVSFSDCSTSLDPVSGVQTHEMSLFTYDVLQGLFYYTIRLSIPPLSSDLPPYLDVQLTGVYPLAIGIIQPPTSATPSNTTYYSNFSPRGPSSSLLSASPGTPTPDADYASRGFLSTHCVGPQAKRAVWIERKRSSTRREVHVWSRERPWDEAVYVKGHLDGGAMKNKSVHDSEGTSSTVEMKKHIVYTLNSYDLRDDINYCALGEVSGTIVLGHRSGDISVLKL